MNKKKSPKKILNGQIRIIGGKWRGRKLSVIDSNGLRPTTDYVRETLFNWLTPYLPGAQCLDCYAGTGALGFEALSRGANKAVFIEKNLAAYQSLIANQDKLAASSFTFVHDNTLHYLMTTAPSPFDIIFLDPPFKENLLCQTAALLEKNNWLAANSLIYIEKEHSHQMLTLPTNWQCYREKVAGTVCFQLYRRIDDKK